MTVILVNDVAFVLVAGYAVYLFYEVIRRRYRYISLGKPVPVAWKESITEYIGGFFAQVFGQKKLLKDKRSGSMHVVMFYGFIVLQFGALDIIARGLSGGRHLPYPAYQVFGATQEIVAALVLVATGYATYRRYIERLPRLKRGWKPSIVLFLIAGLMICVLLELTFTRIWHTLPASGFSPISSPLAAAMTAAGMTQSVAEALFYVFWWLHLLILLTFLLYVPQSKHFHLLAAPVNVLLRKKTSPGRLAPLDLEDENAETFGVGKIEDFTRKQMLDFYACVECGRCTSVCPATGSGKVLSPMHLISKMRDHLTEKGAALTGLTPWQPAYLVAGAAGPHSMIDPLPTPATWPAPSTAPASSMAAALDTAQASSTAAAINTAPAPGPAAAPGATDIVPTLAWQKAAWHTNAEKSVHDISLIGDVITEDEIWACTTCRNCEDQCPVDNEHVDKIIDLRRHLVLMEGSLPSEGQRAMQNIERQGNPWGISRNDRAAWTGDIEGLQVPTVRDNANFEYLLFVGSMGSYDVRTRKVTEAFVRLLTKAGVNFAILGNEEKNSGDTPRRMGNEMLFQQLAMENIETFQKYGVKKIVTACPHTFNTLKNEYPDFGLEGVEVLHHTQLLSQLVREGRLVPRQRVEERIVYHDSCYLGRYNGVYDAPRDILRAIPGVELVEMRRNRENAMCCGAGGGRMWMEETAGKRVNRIRTEQALEVSPTIISSACPYCLTMMDDGTKALEVEEKVSAKDVAEVLAMSVLA